MRLILKKLLLSSLASLGLAFSLKGEVQQPPKKVSIIVLIHGNMDLKPHISFTNFKLFYYDAIEGSFYKDAVTALRADPFFCLHQPMQQLGLHPIDITRTEPGYASGAFVQAHQYIAAHTPIKQKNYKYYTFGWSGLQSPQVRLKDAQKCYQDLTVLVQSYRAQDIEPEVWVMGYSHGGNVGLNLGAFYRSQHRLKVNLVLLGVPIIPESDHYAASPLFASIFHFYSLKDRVQPLDCLGQERIFSGRHFISRPGFKVPSHLHEIRVCIKRIARTYGRTGLPPYAKPDKRNYSTGAVHPFHIRKADPGHVEFWSFGWTTGYRKYFPLYPLPFSVYATSIIDLITTQLPESKNSLIDIHPYEEKIYLQDQQTGTIQSCSFLSQNYFRNLHQLVLPFWPKDYSSTSFTQRVQEVMNEVATPAAIAQKKTKHSTILKVV